MPTTVEITDVQRAKLLELAAERSEKGISRLVQEAIEHYLEENVARKKCIAAAKAVLGTLSEEAAQNLLTAVKATRATWR